MLSRCAKFRGEEEEGEEEEGEEQQQQQEEDEDEEEITCRLGVPELDAGHCPGFLPLL